MKKGLTFPIDSILILGPTGVGKSPLGDALAQNGLFGRKCHHLDFGSELRRAVSDEQQSKHYSSSEFDFIRGVLTRGLLLENEHFPLAGKIISLFLDRSGFFQNNLLVLNGIPRHEGQARDMEKIAKVHAVSVLDCSAEDVLKRIRSNIGGDRTERVDDSAELIGKKLKIFRERTALLVDYYRNAGREIYPVAVTGDMTPRDAYSALSVLAAAHPPVALVAEPPVR